MKYLLVIFFILLSSCTTTKVSENNKGAYYQDDGPHETINAKLDDIQDAIPKVEEINPNAKKPYKVFGEKYVPMTKIIPYKEKGYASWYGKKYHGNKTSTGEVYDMYSMTGAHKTLPLPSYVKVRNLKNRKEIIIRLNDRGPFLKDRIIDLSYAAANKLNIIEKGSELVEVELIDPTKFTNSKVSNGKFIQAGAFKNYSNGELLLKKLEQLNFLNNLDLKVIQIDNLYHVLIGPFDDDRLIELTKDKLKNEYELTTYIKNYGR